MQELYELKEMLCDELKKYGGKGELTAGSLDIVDKLAHATKNLDKVIMAYEEDGYSENDGYYYEDGRSYRDGGNSNRSYRNSYRGSYARGRGRNARRDSMGRYSRDGMADKLRELMESAPDERSKEEIRKLADKMESM